MMIRPNAMKKWNGFITVDCQVCNERIYNKQDLIDHYVNLHPEVFLCKVCLKVFFHQNAFTMHKRLSHTEINLIDLIPAKIKQELIQNASA